MNQEREIEHYFAVFHQGFRIINQGREIEHHFRPSPLHYVCFHKCRRVWFDWFANKGKRRNVRKVGVAFLTCMKRFL